MNKRKNILTLIIGVFAALIIVVGQSGYYFFQEETNKVQSELAQNDNMDGEESSEETPSLNANANQAVVSVFHFNLNCTLHFIYEIYTGVEIDMPVIDLGEIIPFQIYLETLLQRIISPNAP